MLPPALGSDAVAVSGVRVRVVVGQLSWPREVRT